MTPEQPPRDAPPARARPDDVLRYWLAAVRLEETLKVRPRARRSQHSAGVPRLDFPAAGQEYFKLPLGPELSALLCDKQPIPRAFDGELAAFFEGWLLNQYRRSQDESELSHLLCFPVVHLPRGELAGLLRCGVRLRFGTQAGELFSTPSRSARQRNAYPAPPDEVRVSPAPRSEGSWPFFIDTRLLSYPLGLTGEEIDALFETLRSHESVSEQLMISLVTQALEQAASASDSAARAEPALLATEQSGTAAQSGAAPLDRLTQAIRTLLSRGHTRAQVYPVGIVVDGNQAKTTWHLQRELASLTESHEKNDAQLSRTLGAYLQSRQLDAGETPQRALFPGPSLTAHQRRAAEAFWGSPLTAVQGPPGTGKTTLILHLCAEAMVRQVDSLLDSKVMGSRLLVVTSSNNRAVDNVTEPLSQGDALPLALRVGSRQVCEHTLAATLRHTAAWLKLAEVEPSAVLSEQLQEKLSLFATLRAQLDLQLAPRRDALARQRERARLQALIDELPGSGAAVAAHAVPLTEELAAALEPLLVKLERRMRALTKLCGAKPGMAQVNAVARHYEKTAKRDLPPLEAALAEARLSFELPLPPLQTPLDVTELMEVWEEGAELFLERLEQVRERVEQTLEAGRRAQGAAQLHALLRALGPADPGTLPSPGGHDELSQALFLAAVRVREAWARAHAEALHESVSLALRGVEQDRSLRPLFRNEPEHAQQLCRLFGVWGSTLLSLGNCLPVERGSIAHVVIDEAGQCHPAHAVSALMRCESALVIGDVFQLTPVIELTADDSARLLRSLRLRSSAESLEPYLVGSDSQVSAQSLADRAVLTRHALVDHFRCHAQIIAISDALCGYGLQVHAASLEPADGLLLHPVSLLDLPGEQERVAGSLYNQLELRETLALVDRLLGRGARPSEIAVITPYRGQLELLRRGLLERRVPLEHSPELMESEASAARSTGGLALGTVHRFQGGERSIVLFSSVVTRKSSLGFLNERPNLLNVAVSRARHHFVCLGDRSVLAQGERTRLLVEAAQPLLG